MMISGSQYLNIFLLSSLILIYSCTGIKRISQEQSLYGGATIELNSTLGKHDKKEIRKSTKALLIPKPNGKFLWMRPGLSLHNSIKKPKKDKGFKYWLKYKIGQPPVYYEESNSEALTNAMENKLFHQGYFAAHAQYETRVKNRITFVTFNITPGPNNTFSTLTYPQDSSEISTSMLQLQNSTLIEKGDNYKLETLKMERFRINEGLHKDGFYFFEADHVYFKADSGSGKNTVDLTLKFKPTVPDKAFQQYSLSNIYVVDDFQLLPDAKADTSFMDGYYYISTNHLIRPEIVLDEVFLQSGQLYSSDIHNRTINFLMALGNYRFSNIQYINADDSARTLDANIFLSPHKKYSLSAEFNAVSKTNNFIGPGVRLNFVNRNFLRGSEIFATNLSAGYEWQITNNEVGNTSLELSLESSLIIPRIVPFRQNKETKRYLGSSRITGGIGYFNRVELYKFFSLSGSYKYSWIKRPRILHELLPLDISLNNILETTNAFDDYLIQNPSIRRSLEEQFILGTSYNFIYNAFKDRNFIYSGGVEFAGNALSLMGKVIGDPSTEDPKVFLGVPYSQFVRIKNEFSYQIPLSQRNVIATRLIASIGIPYGNSTVLPYVKQFFAGGTNSIRAFRARSIGPGSYIPSDTTSNFLVDQSGDLKFESNLEYRFPIIKYLNGALFIDAGNIWLINDDLNRPGGVFKPENFLSELAIGVGYGLRLDLEILVIRFDWAFPLRKPYLEEGNRWNEIDFLKSNWRKENIILNISIGYPF